MFEYLQIAAKLIIIAAILLAAVFASLKVLRADIDLAKLISPRRIVEKSIDDTVGWIPTRDQDALYQSGKTVARITGATVDEQSGMATFDEISQSNSLDLKAEFEFQKWRLKFRRAEITTYLKATEPQKGRILEKAVADILGLREPL